jgi:galactonate dehydratase
MKIDRRTFARSLTAATTGAIVNPGRVTTTHASAAPARSQANPPKAAGLSPARITKIRLFYPPNYDANGAQAFPQSNMVVLVDTDAGITGVGQGGSPDTVRNVARSVIGKNAFDTEAIWQAAFMDSFYSPGKEKLHALGAIDLALWDIKGKALNAPLYQLFGGKAREHIELYATMGIPPGLVSREEAQKMPLKERAAATMAAGYRVFRVDGAILPRPSASAAAATAVKSGPDDGRGQPGGVFNARSRIRLIAEAAAQIRDGIGADGDWMIDLHQKFDFHEAVEVCNLIAPMRPFCVEDPLREEQFRTQIPKLRLLTTVPLAPGEEWGTRADFSPLVEARDIDFARASLPNVGGITEMLKIMAICDTHKVGIVPHFTGPIATAGHLHTMMAFPGQVLMEFNQGERPVPYLSEFLECRNGKVWPNDRPGLGVTVDLAQLKPIEEITTGAPGVTYRRPDGSLTHW